MSASFTVNKGKRPKPSNDANNSFVKNVTSRVTALLPSTITKWFSSPSSSNTNGSASIAESTDSSTEDEAPESPVTTQPPAKRMRFSSPGTSNTYIPPETKCTSTNTETVGTFTEIQSPISRNAFRPDSNFESTRLHSTSEEETIVKKDTPIYNLESSASNDNTTILKRRKSLFDLNHEDNYVRNTDINLKEPHFNPSLYASPFYNRKTKYGGASSSYMNQPNIKHRKSASVTNNNSNNDNITISHSARRVLDLLENYSSPLMEAKRISQFMKSSNTSNMNNSLDSSIDNNSKKFSYKTQELHVPSIATILRLKQRSRLMDTTSAARQIIASHSSSSDFMSYPVTNNQSTAPKETSEKLTTKIKSRLTRTNRDERIVHETNEPINLPTAVLQIDKDNLPKFSLGTPTSKPLPSSSMKSVTDTVASNLFASTPKLTSNIDTKINENNAKTMKTLPPPVLPKNNFQFSSPVTVSNETVKSTITSKFCFGSPERTIEKTKTSNNDNKNEDTSQAVQEKTDSTTKSEQWKCDDCWVSNKPDSKNCVCCGGKKPIKEKTKTINCSVCKAVLSQGSTNKCTDCEKKSNKTKITKPASVDSSQWKCNDCWVNNDAGADKCVCCGGKKPKELTSVVNSKPESVESTWKCEVCLIRNKSSADKCAACDADKQSSNKSNNKLNVSQPKITSNDSMLKNIVKSQSDKWECPNCLVRNDNNVSKCLCCETEKPGSVKESEKKSFNFGVNPNMSFKFGIDPKQNVAGKTAETTPAALAAPVKELETNNNVLSSSFTFGLPKKKQDTKTDKVEEKTDSVPKPAFTFGIPKQISTELNTKKDNNNPPLGEVKLPEETTKSVSKVDEQQEQATKIEKPKAPFPETLPPVNLFSTPVSNKTTEKPVTNINPPNLLEKNEPTNNSLVSTLKSSAETSLPQNTFTFSSSGIKPATNLFAPQVTTASTTSSSFTTLQAPPVSTSLSFFQKSAPVSSSPLSFFQKPDTTTTTPSLFKNTETPTTAASQPEVSTAPVFSFGGNNTQSSVTQVEKPKFNFTFGSNNKSETPPVFKPIFGATADTNNSTNKFTLTNSNSLNTGNVLSGNTLGSVPGTNAMTGNILSGGNNGMATNNPLAGLTGNNALPTGNTLGGSMLPTNSLSVANNMSQPSNTSAVQPNLFGSSIKKDSLWTPSNNTSSNLFVSNNNVPKPTFTFGSSVPFNANNANPAPTFGSPAQPTQPAQNMFGMSNQNNQPSLFSNTMQNSAPTNIFGASQPASNPAPSVGMFGTPNVGVTPTFGSPNPISTFEAPSMNPTPAPTFNFGAQQPTGIFGFGQQQAQQQPQPQQPAGVYNFGATPTGIAAPQVQFNMGSSPYISGRRVRKAIRRTTQR